MKTPSLYQFLEERGIRKCWLARQLGISAGYLTRMATGQRAFPPEYQARVADVLGVPVRELFADSLCSESTDSLAAAGASNADSAER